MAKLKNTFLFLVLFTISCGNSVVKKDAIENKNESITGSRVNYQGIITGAENHAAYLPLLNKKRVGIVTNQTGILRTSGKIGSIKNEKGDIPQEFEEAGYNISIVDFLIENKVNLTAIFAPEHGFRGTADAGEHVVDGKDKKTGLPIISLYGENKKPSREQLKDLDILIFDLQDVGARFYTYISSLHYIMEACAENNVPLVILDRPNPNGAAVDGPTLEKEFTSFVGMHPIPVLHGMTIGEYGNMINGEKWLKNGIQCQLTVIPCLNYEKNMSYTLPVKPSPNLPNAKAVNLYASLCFFEGTTVSVGRGTDKQFQVYGSPFLPKSNYSFTPMPNEGAKDPPFKGQICYGEDLSSTPKIEKLELKWLLKAYRETSDGSKFFNTFFNKLAGSEKLKQQIISGVDEKTIRDSWSFGLKSFQQIRVKYLLYGEKSKK